MALREAGGESIPAFARAPGKEGSGWRVAVLGLGAAARSLHLPALRKLPGVELVGGCDPDAGRRRLWSEAGVPAFPDADGLLAEAHPDVVVVGTPPESHAPLVELAFAHGAHVICEKPLARSVAEADRLVEAAERTGRRLAVNHLFRAMPIFEALAAELESGRAGRLVFASAWQLMDLPPWREPGWRGALAHRMLYEAGIHLVDLVLTLFGGSPAAVYARAYAGAGAPSPAADAVHLVTLEFPDGRLAQLTFDRLCKGPTRFAELRAGTERASLRASYGGRAAVRAGLLGSFRPTLRWEFGPGGVCWSEVGDRRRTLARNPRNAPAVATGRLFGRILEALRRGEEPPSPAREARDALEVVAAAYASAESGRRIELSDPSAPWRERDLTAAARDAEVTRPRPAAPGHPEREPPRAASDAVSPAAG